MSIPVQIGDVTAALERFGSGYLLTTSDGRVKVVTVDPVGVDGGLRIIGPGRGTLLADALRAIKQMTPAAFAAATIAARA